MCKRHERLVHQPHRQRLAPALAGAPVAARAVAEHLHAADLEPQRSLRRRLVLFPAQVMRWEGEQERSVAVWVQQASCTATLPNSPPQAAPQPHCPPARLPAPPKPHPKPPPPHPGSLAALDVAAVCLGVPGSEPHFYVYDARVAVGARQILKLQQGAPVAAVLHHAICRGWPGGRAEGQ